jgi:hypothetical protein
VGIGNGRRGIVLEEVVVGGIAFVGRSRSIKVDQAFLHSLPISKQTMLERTRTRGYWSGSVRLEK